MCINHPGIRHEVCRGIIRVDERTYDDIYDDYTDWHNMEL